MLLPIDREDIEEMDGFLDDNISFGIDDMEERFVEYCKYIRQYEDQVLPQNWFTAKLGHGKIGSRQNWFTTRLGHGKIGSGQDWVTAKLVHGKIFVYVNSVIWTRYLEPHKVIHL